jgi:predicted DCC family thiol-disulfide oxidoreductase YuxK
LGRITRKDVSLIIATQDAGREYTTNGVILFDGTCEFCNWSAHFIIKRDAGGYFKFAAIQSEAGRKLLARKGLSSEEVATILLIEGCEYFTKSDAAIRVASRLPGLWRVLKALAIIPRPIRNWCYDVVARNRYWWSGKKKRCIVPSREHLSRFLR